MSVETLDSLKQKTGELSAGEKVSLATYLLEQADPGRRVNPKHATEAERRKRQAWIRANRSRYGGLYVALDGELLLGTGKSFAEARKAAETAGSADAFVDFVPPENYVGEIGGWE